MNDKRSPNQPPSGGLALSDIYFVIFRHKWKIIILSLAGFLAAGGIYYFQGVTYQSEADLWIKYVASMQPITPASRGENTVVVDSGGEGIINTEIAILTSFDLAKTVAANVGPEKILAKSGGGTNLIIAANLLRSSLAVERFPKSPVVRIIFSHADYALVQPALTELINDYQNLHTTLHASAGSSFESLAMERDNLHKELMTTEENLRKQKSKMGVSDLEAMKKANSDSLLANHKELANTSLELDLHKALLEKLKSLGKDGAGPTNESAVVSQELIDKYNDTVDLLASLKKAYFELRTSYPDHNKIVIEKKEKMDEVEKLKKQMEKEEPRLAKLKNATPGGQPPVDPIVTEEANVANLELKLQFFQAQLSQLQTDSTNLAAADASISELERQRKLKYEAYMSYFAAADRAKEENDVDATKNGNITVTQTPTPPSLEKSKTPKLMALAALGGIAAGLAWALLVEFYLDHSVRRPKEIEGELGLRLFLSIPDTKRNGHRRLAEASAKKTALIGNGKEELPVPAVNGANGSKTKMEVATWDRNHSLHLYYESLRDRLISYFEVNNLNHKPKLVAVTGSAPGAGTTTIAAGLAASLSETGDGNVLLIDMNLEHGSAQQFYQGKPSCELDAALENETREPAMVQDNLYVVSGDMNGEKLSRMLPKRFANLLPKLKASDYDYIIFDMPPIARTGVTQRLAGFMDMILLVVEAEKTSRDVVRQAGSLLTESKANVSVVLNKTRTYIPNRLHQEFK